MLCWSGKATEFLDDLVSEKALGFAITQRLDHPNYTGHRYAAKFKRNVYVSLLLPKQQRPCGADSR